MVTFFLVGSLHVAWASSPHKASAFSLQQPLAREQKQLGRVCGLAVDSFASLAGAWPRLRLATFHYSRSWDLLDQGLISVRCAHACGRPVPHEEARCPGLVRSLGPSSSSCIAFVVRTVRAHRQAWCWRSCGTPATPADLVYSKTMPHHALTVSPFLKN